MSMTITVRGLDDELHRQIKERARRHHRSMEAEVRAILAGAVTAPTIDVRWVGEESPEDGPHRDADADGDWIDRARSVLDEAWADPAWDEDWLPERPEAPSRPAAELDG